MVAASFSPTIVLKLKPKSTIAKPGPRTGIVKRRLLAEIFPIGLGASHRVESIISDSGSASLPSHLNLQVIIISYKLLFTFYEKLAFLAQ